MGYGNVLWGCQYISIITRKQLKLAANSHLILTDESTVRQLIGSEKQPCKMSKLKLLGGFLCIILHSLNSSLHLFISLSPASVPESYLLGQLALFYHSITDISTNKSKDPKPDHLISGANINSSNMSRVITLLSKLWPLNTHPIKISDIIDWYLRHYHSRSVFCTIVIQMHKHCVLLDLYREDSFRNKTTVTHKDIDLNWPRTAAQSSSCTESIMLANTF